MPIYEWKRVKDTGTILGIPGTQVTEWEYTETTTTDSPEGDGWQRVYSYGVGAVKGAGLSPSRQVNGR